MSEARLIATIEKNSREEVRVSLDQFKGHDLVDIRTFADFDDVGERRATKKGVSLKRERLPDLIEALQQAMREGGLG